MAFKDKEKEKAYYKEYREANKEKIKTYREVNKEKIRERNKTYYEANKEKLNEKSNENNRLYYEANKEKVDEKHRLYYEANKEKLSEKKKTYYETNKEKVMYRYKVNRLRQQYNITLEQRRGMIEAQGHMCAVCRISFKCIVDKSIHIDHCHKRDAEGKKVVRGILCAKCNQALGLMKDNPKILRAAAKYLEDFEKSQQPKQLSLLDAEKTTE
jgi:hypothetical protein